MRRTHRRARFIAAAAACLPLLTALGQPSDMDAWVERARAQFKVPGIAVAIVRDGRTVLAKGYGVRSLNGGERVDEHTRFAIASNSKAFTATAIAMLVEEGKLEWNAPVTRYLPWFALDDPCVTHELTVLDLLVHRSGLGLGAGDLLWWPGTDFTRREIAERLRALPLATSFRDTFAYDNVLYLVAGELISAVTGMTWEEFVNDRIVRRAAMPDADVHSSQTGKGDDAAQPHALIDGTLRPIAVFGHDNTNPAGGIQASALDMAAWMRVQLDSGRIDGGERLYSARTAERLWTLVTPEAIRPVPPELSAVRMNFNGYALGFEVYDYRGVKHVGHSGGWPGYVSRVAMLPSLKLGVAVLTNMESGEAFESIARHVLDSYLGAARTDWIAAYATRRARIDSVIAATLQRSATARNPASGPSLPLASYAGTYRDAWYGDVAISLENGTLVIRFTHTPALTGTLEHWQNDTFVARWRDPELRADAYLTFALTPDGTVDHANMRAFSPATDFSFDFQDLLLRPVAPK